MLNLYLIMEGNKQPSLITSQEHKNKKEAIKAAKHIIRGIGERVFVYNKNNNVIFRTHKFKLKT